MECCGFGERRSKCWLPRPSFQRLWFLPWRRRATAKSGWGLQPVSSISQMGGLHALHVFRIRKSIVCYPWVTGNCGSVPVKDYIEGMALSSAGLTCRQLWLRSRCSLFCETTMATYGPEQREVFFASTPLAFRFPMSPTLEAGVSTRCLRIEKGISGPEVDAAWSASGTAYLLATH